MNYNRREFIKFGSLAFGFVSTLTNFGFGSAIAGNGTFYSQNYYSFLKLIGSEFTFYKTDSAATAVLTEVKNFESSGRKLIGECFSLLFEMPSDEFGQETYQIFHPSLGTFYLLSVPGICKKGDPCLIAVINRL